MRVVVVGGGLLGSAAAWHLAQQQVSCTLFDAGEAGDATSAGAGILSGATSGGPGPAYWALAEAAGEYHRQLASQRPAGAAGYAPAPLAIVAMAGDEAPWRAVQKTLSDRGAPVQEVDPAKIATAFPPLGPVACALWHDGAARVDGRLLARWLREAAESQGAALRTERVQQLMLGDGRVSGVVLASGERVPADAVIVAAGAWTTALLDPVAPTLPIAPQRGQIVHLRVPQARGQSWPMVQGVRGHYLLPWPDGHVVAGASRETGSGFAPELTAGGEAEVLAEAVRAAPGLAAAPVMEWRVGLRPTSADGMPLLGALGAAPGVHVLAGHGAGGLLVGPLSAKLVVDGLLERETAIDLKPFRPNRAGPTHH